MIEYTYSITERKTTMPTKRVTMQDIADACGLSRNTVSKAFNGRGTVPQSTRELILRKAAELGYGTPAEAQPSAVRSGGSIALLTSDMPRDFHFGTIFMTSFTDQISRSGYTLKIFEISREELEQKKLPPHFSPDQISGMVGIELFDPAYLDMICSLGLPVMMIDGPAHAFAEPMACDFVTMENVSGIVSVVRRLYGKGARRIGFVGDREHCASFFERWVGYTSALNILGIPLDEKICLLMPNGSPVDDPDWLIGELDRMPGLPDAFACVNDYQAIHLMNALKKKGLRIPEDIMVAGFDGTSQAALVDPPLSTVRIPSTEMGRMAADVLLFRINSRDMPYVWIRVRTEPVWRRSTRD